MGLRESTLALAAVFATTCPQIALAGAGSLLADGVLGQGRGRLIDARVASPVAAEARASWGVGSELQEAPRQSTGASLFLGSTSGFFAPLPPRPQDALAIRRGPGLGTLGPAATGVERLRQLIARAEAGAADYDAINYGARRLPSRRPTEMTLGEIYAWIDATPGQPHAIGRYQFIPSTLRRLAREIGAREHERFSPHLQDLLADELFAEAGLPAVRDGLMSRRQFMNNLAKIWAGLPNSSGRSHYHGYAGNRATMTWASFEAEMAKIFPS